MRCVSKKTNEYVSHHNPTFMDVIESIRSRQVDDFTTVSLYHSPSVDRGAYTGLIITKGKHERYAVVFFDTRPKMKGFKHERYELIEPDAKVGKLYGMVFVTDDGDRFNVPIRETISEEILLQVVTYFLENNGELLPTVERKFTPNG